MEPQAPKLTSHENRASLGPRKKKGGRPPSADNRPRNAKLKSLPYRWGWGQWDPLLWASRLHPNPSRAATRKTSRR